MKVPCGGFRIDDDTLKLKDDGTLYAAGGGGGSIPKPLTYDYMPEGYPSKSVGTVTLMEEQEVTFSDMGGGAYGATAPVKIDISDGQTYTIFWDGVEYSCVGHVADGSSYIGNPAAFGAESTGEPFLYANASQPMWVSYDTATSHTIKATTIGTVYNTIDVNMLPKAGENYGVVKKDEIVTAYVFPNRAPQAEMNKAVDDFIAGKASISWGNSKIIYAERPSDTEIHVALSDDPTNYVKCAALKNNFGSYYDRSMGEPISSESSMTGIQLNDYDDPSSGSIAIRASIDSNNSANNHVSFGLASIYDNGIVIKSSSSNKMFKITVNDSGTLSATEVTS